MTEVGCFLRKTVSGEQFPEPRLDCRAFTTGRDPVALPAM
jgi:hypothetical protein